MTSGIAPGSEKQQDFVVLQKCFLLEHSHGYQFLHRKQFVPKSHCSCTGWSVFSLSVPGTVKTTSMGNSPCSTHIAKVSTPEPSYFHTFPVEQYQQDCVSNTFRVFYITIHLLFTTYHFFLSLLCCFLLNHLLFFILISEDVLSWLGSHRTVGNMNPTVRGRKSVSYYGK